MHILFSATLAIIILGTGQVNAADNLAGGGAFGATCTDDSNGKTCSCTPPSTSPDCAKLLDNCANTVVDVDPWTDDLGHEHSNQRIPDVTCTATKCECAWIGKTSGGLPKPALIYSNKH